MEDAVMKTLMMGLVTIAACCLMAGPIFAQDATCDVACCDDAACCDTGGCCSGWACGGLTFDAELTFLRFGQEGGVTDSTGSPAEYDFELAPRFELGYELDSGLGVRTRYWYYDHDAVSAAGNPIGVDTNQFDIEVYQRFCVTCNTDIEISGGARWLDFQQSATDLAAPGAIQNDTDPFGGIVALQLTRRISFGALYTRARWGILQGDATIVNITPIGTTSYSAQDNMVQQLELAAGWEAGRCTDWGLVSVRLGAEWQQWANVAAADTVFGGIGNDDVLEDAGFAVFLVGLGVER